MRRPHLAVLLALAAPAVAQAQEEPAFREQVWNAGVKAPDWRSERPQWAKVYDAALAALLARQRGDGSFAATAKTDLTPASAVVDVAATAVAILAIEAGGSTLRVGPHKRPLMESVRWLRGIQQPDGWFVPAAAADAPLAQTLAAMAMTRTMLESRYTLLKASARNGMVAAIAPAPNQPADPLSLALMLPLAGRPGGISDIDPTAASWCQPAVDSLVATLGPRGQITWQGARPTMSGPLPQPEELAALALLATPPDAIPAAIAERLGSTRQLLDRLPTRWTKAADVDGLSLALGTAAAARVGGETWTTWQGIVDRHALTLQRRDGDDAGTFAFAAGPDLLANPTAATALAMLALAADAAR